MSQSLEASSVQIDQMVADALRLVLKHPFPIPPDFDEAAYLGSYPDVADAVAKGHVPSGFAHYIAYGRAEGRARPFKAPDPAGAGAVGED